jgi:polysaccharide pyruvyl transferase WcaK-like protein
MKLLWVINRYNDPNYGDIGICKAISGFLIDHGYQIRNFDFIGKKFKFQFTRTIYILTQIFLVFRERPTLLIVGGGQLLLNNRSFPYAMLGWYLVSKISHVPILAFSVGTERNSEDNFFYRKALRLFLGHAAQVYLRDSDSQEAIHRITGLHFDTVPDAVYLSHGKVPVNHAVKNSDALVFVSNKSKTKQSKEKYYDEILDALTRRANYGNVIISASSEQDFKAAQGFYNYSYSLGLNFRLEIAHSFEHFLQQIANTNLVISSRMHPLIYAHLMGKSFIPIPTNQKTKTMASFLMTQNAESLAADAKIKLINALNKFNIL